MDSLYLFMEGVIVEGEGSYACPCWLWKGSDVKCVQQKCKIIGWDVYFYSQQDRQIYPVRKEGFLAILEHPPFSSEGNMCLHCSELLYTVQCTLPWP
jgi:hypothetical protein